MEKQDKIFTGVIVGIGILLLVGFFYWPIAEKQTQLDDKKAEKKNVVDALAGIHRGVFIATTNNDYRVAYADKLEELADANKKLVDSFASLNEKLDIPLTGKSNEDKLDFGDAYEKKCQELLAGWGIAATPENLKRFSMRLRSSITPENLKDVRREYWLVYELLLSATGAMCEIETEKVKFVWIHDDECEYPNNDDTKFCLKCGLTKQLKEKRLDPSDMYWGMGWKIEKEKSTRSIESISEITIKTKDAKNVPADPNTKALTALNKPYSYETVAKSDTGKTTSSVTFQGGKFTTWTVTVKVVGHLTVVEKYFRTIAGTTNFMFQPRSMNIVAPSVPWAKIFPPQPGAVPPPVPAAGAPGAAPAPVVYGDYREPDVQGELVFDVVFFEPLPKAGK